MQVAEKNKKRKKRDQAKKTCSCCWWRRRWWWWQWRGSGWFCLLFSSFPLLLTPFLPLGLENSISHVNKLIYSSILLFMFCLFSYFSLFFFSFSSFSLPPRSNKLQKLNSKLFFFSFYKGGRASRNLLIRTLGLLGWILTLNVTLFLEKND